MSSPEEPPKRGPVITVSSNKGGVGKTTLATNLAIYVRALREDLPVLILGLDDQKTLDRMFALRELEPGDGNLKHGWAERCLTRTIQLGEYGVHFVPSPPDVAMLKARAEDRRTLSRIIDPTGPNSADDSQGSKLGRRLTSAHYRYIDFLPVPCTLVGRQM